MNEQISCPKCGHNFEISEGFLRRIEENLRQEFNKKYIDKKKEIKEETKKEVEQSFSVEIKDLKSQVAENQKKLAISEQKELEFRKLKREIEEKEKQLEIEAQKKFDELKTKYKDEIVKQIEANKELEFNDIKKQLEEKSELLKKSQTNELELRKKQRELEERERNFTLEMERKLDEERNKIIYDTTNNLTEKFRLLEADKNKQLEGMRIQIEELKRKSEQGSQQTQGEVLELELENVLKNNFRFDEILPVPKGVKGADITQKVRNQQGIECGIILWETKRTKNWSDEWITKLKDDQRAMKATLAIIVSIALPKEIKRIGFVDGVWISDFSSALGLAMVLRSNIIEIAQIHNSMAGKNEKMEILYNYFAGQEFRQRMEAILETFISMKEDLDIEKRSITAIWAKREKQIERITNSTSSLYGDMKEIIGKALQPMSKLELPAPEEDSDLPFNVLEKEIKSEKDEENLPF